MDNVSELNCLPFPATALTPDNVINELKEVNWKTLCDTRFSVGGTFRGVLELPKSKVQRIEKMYVLEEERKSAGVLWWVDHHPLASWRLLITRLDAVRQHSLANRIHQYAEKVTGMLSSIFIDSYTIPVNILKLIHMYTPISGLEYEVHICKVVPSMACV